MDGHGGFVVYVNKREVRVPGAVLDASEILTFAGFSPDEYSLFLVSGQAGAGGGPGQAGAGGGPGQAGAGGGPGQAGAGGGPGQAGAGGGPGQIAPGQIAPGQIAPGQIAPGQIAPGQTITMCDGLQFHAILKSVPYG